MRNWWERMRTSRLAAIGFVLAIVAHVIGLIVCLRVLRRIDQRRKHVVRRDGGEALATAGVAIAGLSILVTFGVFATHLG
jgi:hypothetical protein